MNANAEQVFNVWDKLLNDMYGALKANLPADEFAQLQAEQRQWITERDQHAEQSAAEVEGGTLYTSKEVNEVGQALANNASELQNEIRRFKV